MNNILAITYKELKSRLPSRNKRVGTAEGPGLVIDTKILLQLVLVRLEDDLREIAVPVEELMDPERCPRPAAATSSPSWPTRSAPRPARKAVCPGPPGSAHGSRCRCRLTPHVRSRAGQPVQGHSLLPPGGEPAGAPRQ